MQNIKKNLATILLSVACTLLFVAVILLIVNNNTYKFNNSSNKNDTFKNNTKEVEKNKKEEIEEIKEEQVEEVKQEEVKTEEKKETIKVEEEKEENNNVNLIKSEANLLSFLDNQSELFSNSNTDETFTSKLKASFVGLIDFIFYDKEINGYKFNDLTSVAKLKVISIALAIDNKINTYFPQYKEKIKDKYQDMSARLAAKYIEITSEFCSKDPETCKIARQNFDEMKESFGLTWDKVKEATKNGSKKLKDLYENWR